MEEIMIDKYPKPITMKTTETILDQMKHKICKIHTKNIKGSGFFCYITYNDIKKYQL